MEELSDPAKLAESLSARRAWIEIRCCAISCITEGVALRKESVDRNTNPGSTSLTFPGVALRKESVDRNNIIYLSFLHRAVSRSPQGERG